ncbi:calcium-binding protein [Microvirga antarctica]|uniref:calcium-binding protein n=1 Tax=Microvirga antarctica TaxID=2819233 RepID=UPI001B313CA7|nr:calcium-binding protein [Microvirga antarctica]
MATLTFSNALPAGRRLEDFLKPVTLPITFGPGSAAFQVDDYGSPVDVVYKGPSIGANAGNVSFLSIGGSWLTYGADDNVTRFSYQGSLETFHASGATAAAEIMKGDDSIIGSDNGDFLEGYAGNDTLQGGKGSDTMVGGSGNDTYYVDDGADRTTENANGGYDRVFTSVDFALAYSDEVEELRATASHAVALTGSGTSNLIVGTAFNDTLNGAGGIDTLMGGAGDDTYIVNNPADVLIEEAGAGLDTVLTRTDYALGANFEILKAIAGGSVGRMAGNELNNEITGNTGANTLYGYGGNDTLYGDGGHDRLIGGDGSDILFAGIGNDSLYGGTGNDTLYGDVGNDYLRGEDGNDKIYGGAGNDTLLGDKGNDLLYGDVGNDKIYGGAGNDKLYGGLGKNALYGGDGNDVLYGGIHAETLNGDAGNDKLYGDAGNDLINGGLGNDVLSGGPGADTFLFNTKLGPKNVDRIVDFTVGYDKIRLDDLVFKGFGHRGKLSADEFHIGSAAQDSSDHVIYNASTGSLFFDPDGAGGAAQIRFAILKPGLALGPGDFYII